MRTISHYVNNKISSLLLAFTEMTVCSPLRTNIIKNQKHIMP